MLALCHSLRSLPQELSLPYYLDWYFSSLDLSVWTDTSLSTTCVSGTAAASKASVFIGVPEYSMSD